MKLPFSAVGATGRDFVTTGPFSRAIPTSNPLPDPARTVPVARMAGRAQNPRAGSADPHLNLSCATRTGSREMRASRANSAPATTASPATSPHHMP